MNVGAYEHRLKITSFWFKLSSALVDILRKKEHLKILFTLKDLKSQFLLTSANSNDSLSWF